MRTHDHTATIVMPASSVVGEEYDLTRSCPRRGGKPVCEDLSLALGDGIKYGVEELIELVRLTAQESSLLHQ